MKMKLLLLVLVLLILLKLLVYLYPFYSLFIPKTSYPNLIDAKNLILSNCSDQKMQNKNLWKEINAGPFTVSVPPGIHLILGRGIDSFVGELYGCDIKFGFDYGIYGQEPAENSTILYKKVESQQGVSISEAIRTDNKHILSGTVYPSTKKGLYGFLAIYSVTDNEKNKDLKIEIIKSVQLNKHFGLFGEVAKVDKKPVTKISFGMMLNFSIAIFTVFYIVTNGFMWAKNRSNLEVVKHTKNNLVILLSIIFITVLIIFISNTVLGFFGLKLY